MKAIVCSTWGKADLLEYKDLPEPSPLPGEVLVTLKAAAVNFADTLMVQGLYQVKPDLPFIPGFEFSGEVTALGDGVTHLGLGQCVAGFIEFGAFAEKLSVPATRLLSIPSSMDFKTAAGFAVTYGTAHVALGHRGQLKEGETLLVHGASGGVGLAAVELGKLMGATVIATASTQEKLELCKAHGADHLINYSKDDFVTRVKEITGKRGADVILDPVGGDVFEKSLRCIAWEGRLLVIGFASGQIAKAPANLMLVKNCSVVGVYWGAYGQKNPEVLMGSLAQVVSWHAEGKLKPHISKIYPLAQAAQAFADLIERRATGKIILEP